MAKKDQRVCSVTGIKTSGDNFYRNQNHVKAVDNIRRNTEVTKEQLTRMFNQINNY
jgi:uridine phosphorylase